MECLPGSTLTNHYFQYSVTLIKSLLDDNKSSWKWTFKLQLQFFTNHPPFLVLCILYMCCMWIWAKKISVAMIRLHLWYYYFSPPPPHFLMIFSETRVMSLRVTRAMLSSTPGCLQDILPRVSVRNQQCRVSNIGTFAQFKGSKELFSTMYYIECSWQKVIANVEMLTHDKFTLYRMLTYWAYCKRNKERTKKLCNMVPVLQYDTMTRAVSTPW